jgi:hypothetical protein
MDMDSTSSAVALTQVLDVPELLENILSFLPEREILTSVQLVSQTWRSSIVGSPRIQKSLFLPKGKKPAVSPDSPATTTYQFSAGLFMARQLRPTTFSQITTACTQNVIWITSSDILTYS